MGKEKFRESWGQRRLTLMRRGDYGCRKVLRGKILDRMESQEIQSLWAFREESEGRCGYILQRTSLFGQITQCEEVLIGGSYSNTAKLPNSGGDWALERDGEWDKTRNRIGIWIGDIYPGRMSRTGGNGLERRWDLGGTESVWYFSDGLELVLDVIKQVKMAFWGFESGNIVIRDLLGASTKAHFFSPLQYFLSLIFFSFYFICQYRNRCL